MIKNEIINEVSRDTGISKSGVKQVLESLSDTVQQALGRGEEVNLAGIGKFKVKDRKPRPARNPKTGESVSLPARQVVRFSPSSNLKKRVAALKV